MVLQKMLKEVLASNNNKLIATILQMLRKADKITLYGITSMPTAYQTKPEIANIVKSAIMNIN
jgi:hypothetical protein